MTVVTAPLPEAYATIAHTARRHTPRRRAIARAMTSAAQIPTLTADVRIDLTAAIAVRSAWSATDEGGRKPSLLALISWAAVRTLTAFPALNATWGEDAILEWEPVNLGIAVDTPKGLVVPVIRDAGTLSAPELAAAIASAAEKARGRGLQLSDLEGGTFTISNPGAVGPTVRAEALLNVPQVALLGLPGIVRQPVVAKHGADERVEIRSTLTPSLTFDHRPIDGAEAVRYLVALRDVLQGADEAAYRTAARDDRTPK